MRTDLPGKYAAYTAPDLRLKLCRRLL